MRSAKPVPYWWVIALTAALSVPAALGLGGFALLARENCDATCGTSHATTLEVLAAVLLVLSIASAAATSLRRVSLAYLSWLATLAAWAAAVMLLTSC